MVLKKIEIVGTSPDAFYKAVENAIEGAAETVRGMKYAEVAVNSPLAQPRTFCYAIPPDMFVSVGQAVWVPFGPRMIQGLVFAVSEEPAAEETREIAELIDSRPMLSPHQVELARWLSERYLSPLFDAAALMLPPGFERRVLTFIEPVSSPSEAALASLNAKQREMLLLLQRRGKMELGQLKKKLKGEKVDLVIDQLLRKGLVTTVGAAPVVVQPLRSPSKSPLTTTSSGGRRVKVRGMVVVVLYTSMAIGSGEPYALRLAVTS